MGRVIRCHVVLQDWCGMGSDDTQSAIRYALTRATASCVVVVAAGDSPGRSGALSKRLM